MRQYPVLHHYRDRKPGVIASVPWDMLTPHAEQAERNHGQTLHRLAERGGLSPQEMLAVLDGVGWGEIGSHYPDSAEAIREIERRAAAFVAAKTQPTE